MTLAIIFESVGVGEWFVLLAVLLIVVGPKRLPSTARKFGQYYSKFRRAADGFKRQLMDMDTELNNAVANAEKEVSSVADEIAPLDDGAPEDGYEAYGLSQEDYETDYGSVEEGSSEPEKPAAEPEKPAAVEKPAAADKTAVKISVSPAPANGN